MTPPRRPQHESPRHRLNPTPHPPQPRPPPPSPPAPPTCDTSLWFSFSHVSLMAALWSKRCANLSNFSCRISSSLRATSLSCSAFSKVLHAFGMGGVGNGIFIGEGAAPEDPPNPERMEVYGQRDLEWEETHVGHRQLFIGSSLSHRRPSMGSSYNPGVQEGRDPMGVPYDLLWGHPTSSMGPLPYERSANETSRRMETVPNSRLGHPCAYQRPPMGPPRGVCKLCGVAP